MVVVLLLGGSLLLFDCGWGSGYCYVVFCMLLCRGCSFCSGCRILSFCILLSCGLVLHIWSMLGHFWCLRDLVDCHFVACCDCLVWLLFCDWLCLWCCFVSMVCYDLPHRLRWSRAGPLGRNLLLAILSHFWVAHTGRLHQTWLCKHGEPGLCWSVLLVDLISCCCF